MAGKKPGPICSSDLGAKWIDDGTMCRARSSSPGLLGLAMSLVMGAVPEDKDKAGQQQAAKAMFGYDIDIIAKSPFGRTREGKEIVTLLRSLNERGDIEYGKNLDGSRGDWDGKTIRVSEDFRGIAFRTITELVHEASHALWRKNHAVSTDAVERRKNDVDDELHARENQLVIYKYLKETKQWPEDIELERRLKQQADGTLRQSVEQSFSE